MSRWITALLGLAACQPPLVTPDAPQRDMPTDAAPPPWWTPMPGEVDGWDIQLTPNPTAPAFELPVRFEGDPPNPILAAFVLNLWDVIPREMTMEFDDGNVVVPAGQVALEVEVMHARRPRPTLICRIDTGRLQLTDPDAMKFPGFAANPPDDPTPAAAGSVIGWSSGLPDGVRWLDILGARPKLLELMKKRIALAKAAGCDAILADGNDQYAVKRDDGSGEGGDASGFGARILLNDNISWFVEVAKLAHASDIELSVGFKGGGALTSSDIIGNFDWAFAERCGELQDCSDYSGFLRGEGGFGAKAVLALDLNRTVPGEQGMPARGPGQFCNAQAAGGITDGIIKDEALSTAHWAHCINPTNTPVDAGVDSQ